MSDQEYSDLFYGGRPFVRRTSGGGKGRRKNPRNRQGEIMTCDECGADDHFRAQCPRRGQQQRAMFTTSAPPPVPSSVQELGPVGDLFLFATDASASSPDSIQSNATTIPAEQAAPIPQWMHQIYHPTPSATMPAEAPALARTDLGNFSPPGATSEINRLPHGNDNAGGQQTPWPQTPTQAAYGHVENVTQLPNWPPFPTESINRLPSVGPQDAMTTYPILSQFSYVENMRLERLRQQS